MRSAQCMRASAALVVALLCITRFTAAEQVILERKSAFQTLVVSEDAQGMRTLRFGHSGARQSVVKLGDPDHLELPYTRAMPIALIFVDHPASALVIGLGGGTIPGFLHKRFPAMKIDVVDIDPVVVEVAKSHFGFRENSKMHVHVADGRDFVEQAKDRYDLVFLDAFGADSVPARLTTREFLVSVRNTLGERGCTVGNLWGREVNRLYDSMVKTYRAVYDEVWVVDVPGSGNKIVLACPWKSGLEDNDMSTRARAVASRLQLRHDIVEMVERHLRAPGDDGTTGKLLIDPPPGETAPR